MVFEISMPHVPRSQLLAPQATKSQACLGAGHMSPISIHIYIYIYTYIICVYIYIGDLLQGLLRGILGV